MGETMIAKWKRKAQKKFGEICEMWLHKQCFREAEVGRRLVWDGGWMRDEISNKIKDEKSFSHSEVFHWNPIMSYCYAWKEFWKKRTWNIPLASWLEVRDAGEGKGRVGDVSALAGVISNEIRYFRFSYITEKALRFLRRILNYSVNYWSLSLSLARCSSGWILKF